MSLIIFFLILLWTTSDNLTGHYFTNKQLAKHKCFERRKLLWSEKANDRTYSRLWLWNQIHQIHFFLLDIFSSLGLRHNWIPPPQIIKLKSKIPFHRGFAQFKTLFLYLGRKGCNKEIHVAIYSTHLSSIYYVHRTRYYWVCRDELVMKPVPKEQL